MARAIRGPAERPVRITSAPPVKRAARAAGKRLVGQQPSEPGGALDGRKGGTLSKYEKLAPLRFIKSKDHYGRSNQGPMEVGARPRSILDQTIGGRSTDLFFY